MEPLTTENDIVPYMTSFVIQHDAQRYSLLLVCINDMETYLSKVSVMVERLWSYDLFFFQWKRAPIF